MPFRRARLVLFMVSLGVTPALAQDATRAAGPLADVPAVSRLEPLVARIAPTVVARALPRTFQVVEVSLPADLPLGQPIPYIVDPMGGATVLGRRSGVLTALDRDGPRSVLVTLSVPTSAPAGNIEVARVQFSPPNARPVAVPVELIVEPTEQLQLTVQEALRGVRPGDRFTLTYRLTNFGNAPVLVAVRPILPVGWNLVAAGPAMRLGIRATVDQAMTVAVPFNAGTGSLRVRLIASVAGVPQTTVEAIVEVVGSRDASGGAGPVVSSVIAFGWDPAGQSATGVAIGVDGHLTDKVQIQARASTLSTPVSGARYSLSQVGFTQAPSMLQLTAAHWRLGLGATGTEFSQLTGVGINGEGISAELSHQGWHASMILAHPGYGALPERGLLAGGRLEMTVGPVLLAGSATHFIDAQDTTTRRLDALAVGATVAHVWSGTFAGELAERWTAAGASPGWSLSYDRTDPTNSFSMRVLHAPGGGGAFAQATNQVFAAGGERISRSLSLGGSYAMSNDNSGTSFAQLRTSSWNAGPRLQLSRALGFSLSARQSAFAASGSGGAFSNSETGGDATAAFREGRIYLMSLGSVIQAASETSTPSGGKLSQRGWQATINTTAGLNTEVGTFEVNSQITHSAPGSGQLPYQVDVALRADRVPLVARRALQIYVNASVRRTYTPGLMVARTEESVGITAELPLGFSLGLSAQRSPFLLTGTAAGGWAYAMRFGRGTRLPQVSGTDARGVVFSDLNGNGMLDPGELGIASVMVRRGNESVVTGSDGGYRFPGVTRDSIYVDAASLRVGLIVGRAMQRGNRREVAVIALSPVIIELERSGDDLVRADSTALSVVIVQARDEGGKVWVARRTSAVVAIFDALPAGRYTVQVDVSDVQEKLETRQAQLAFTVGGAASIPHLRIVLYARPVRVNRLDISTPATGPHRP